MRKLIQKLKAWYLRRFRGFVGPAAGGGTAWQEHGRLEVGFTCRCGAALAFSAQDLFIRSRSHVDNCPAIFEDSSAVACECPIQSARYVVHCPQCRLGHWKDGSTRKDHAR